MDLADITPTAIPVQIGAARRFSCQKTLLEPTGYSHSQTDNIYHKLFINNILYKMQQTYPQCANSLHCYYSLKTFSV